MKVVDYITLLFFAFVIGMCLHGCRHVCATEWEVKQGVYHELKNGPGAEAALSIGGKIGREECAK